MSRNLLKFTLVVISAYVLIQIYLLFGTWLSNALTMLFYLVLPFVFGYFVSFMIAPGLSFIGKKVRLSPSLVLTFILLLIVGSLVFVSTNFFPFIIEQFTNISTSLIKASDTNAERINQVFSQLGIDLEAQLSFSHIMQSVVQFFTSHSSLITGVTSKFFSSVLSIGSFLLFFVLTLFYTIDSVEAKSQNRIARLREKNYNMFADLLVRTDQIFRLYFRGVFVSMIFVAIGSSLGFWLLGLPNPVGLGLICGLLNVVPLIGPYVGAFPAAFVALSHGWSSLLYVGLIVLVVQQIEGNFVAPNIQGKFLDIQPLSILIGIVVFGSLFGVMGMIFAAPFSAILKIGLIYLRAKMPILKNYWNTIVHSE